MKRILARIALVIVTVPMLSSCGSDAPPRPPSATPAATQQVRDQMEALTPTPSAATAPGGGSTLRDLAYGPAPAQTMDVYLPAQPAGPVILMAHGGGWRIGDKAMDRVVHNKAAHWLPQGIIFISINYRMLPDAGPLEQADDVAKALAAAQAQAPGWGGDPTRFVLMGHSAGAHLVSLITADPAIATRQGARPWLGTVSLDSAAFDIVERMQQQPHLPLYDDAFGTDPNFWRQASPLHRLSGTIAPMLIVCSSLRADACPQGEAFAASATASGSTVTILPEPLSHRAINEQLGLPGDYTDAVDAFLRSLDILGQ